MSLHKTAVFSVAAKAAALIPLLLVLYPNFAFAHDDEDHCMAVKASVADAGFSDIVKVTCENGKAKASMSALRAHC